MDGVSTGHLRSQQTDTAGMLLNLGVATDRIAAQDQPCDLIPAQPQGWEQVGKLFRIGSPGLAVRWS